MTLRSMFSYTLISQLKSDILAFFLLVKQESYLTHIISKIQAALHCHKELQNKREGNGSKKYSICGGKEHDFMQRIHPPRMDIA